MLVDLVQTTTRDGIRLDGTYQSATGASAAIDAVVCVHGTGSNFYGSTLFDTLAESFLSWGIGVLRINTRGHDLMSAAATPRGGIRLGAAYELVDDCRHDLAGWIAWLKDHGAARIGLVGHSLGAVKCLYAQSHEPDPAVMRVIAISPPCLSHSWFLQSEQRNEFRDTYNRAKMLVDAREGDTLLDVRLPLPFIITATGYVEKYGPDERYNYLTFISTVSCPILLTLGERETTSNIAFQGAAEAISRVAPAIKVETIAEADHFYSGRREALLTCIKASVEA
jgi:alpha/beta superfamily hydrolase